MALWLLDSNILLRSVNRSDPQFALTLQATVTLVGRGDRLCFTLQGLSEFWNACTRPATARGGLGLSIAETEKRVRIIERVGTFLPDTEAVRVHWRRLVFTHQVHGVQVHDARVVAAMQAHGLTHLLTYNLADFQRYGGLVVAHPQDVINGNV